MTRAMLFMLMGLSVAWSVKAQTPVDLNAGLQVAPAMTPGDFTMTWWGGSGRTYFIQQSFDLVEWNWVPVVESGADAVSGLNFSCSDERQFWRLVQTDAPTGGNALTADFDGDGVSNADEVSAAYGTNPFLADSDWDGYTDLAEVIAGTNPNSGPSNPNTIQPGNGPLNPDLSYRNGVRLAYSRKFMHAEYHGWANGGFSCEGYGTHSAAGGLTFFSPWATSSTQNLIPGISTSYETTPFLPPDRHLFQTSNLEVLQSQEYRVVSPGTSGPITAIHDIWRFRDEVQAQLSPAAPGDAQRTLAAFLYEGGTSVANLKETGTITFSQHNVSPSATMVRHCQGAGNKVIIEAKLDPNPPDLDPSPTVTVNNQNLYLVLRDVDIEPDAGMAGVLGDVVKSARVGSRIRHFVTPKKSDELPQDYVEFTALGADATTFDELFEWQGGEPGSAANKRKVKRDATGTGPTKLEIWTKKQALVDEMYVWVVWAPVVVANVTLPATVLVDQLTGGHIGTKSGADWEFEAWIQPAAIIVASGDIPDLRGASTNPERPPESQIGNHALDGLPFIDPGSKWDLSRCWRARTIASTVSATDCDIPPGIIAGDYPTPAGGKTHATTPNAAADHFPANMLESNDYHLTVQNPYADGATPGKLVDTDKPRHFVKTSAGAVGDVVETRYHFGVFSRLQIGTKWYCLSDRKPWRFHGKYRKASETAENNDFNNDGDKLDEIWIDAGTISDDTNGGFEP